MKTKPRSNPRPGFVLEADDQTPDVVFPHGEMFTLESLPVGQSRIVYPSEPFRGPHDNPTEIKGSLNSPINGNPLSDLLTSETKLTIVFNDISSSC